MEKLKEPFTKMIESIIRRYRLYYPDEDFDETFNKTFSFLITKFDKFKPDKNPKAYSYYQTIIKNFLLGRLSNRYGFKRYTIYISSSCQTRILCFTNS